LIGPALIKPGAYHFNRCHIINDFYCTHTYILCYAYIAVYRVIESRYISDDKTLKTMAASSARSSRRLCLSLPRV